MKLGKYQDLYRRYMRCLDTHFSDEYSNQENWMLSHLDDFYTDANCKHDLYWLCNPKSKADIVPLNFRSIEELELKLAIYGV